MRLDDTRLQDPVHLGQPQPRNAPWDRQWLRALGFVAFVVLISVIAANRASLQQVGTDFHVFWQAGYDFAHGLPLYQPLPGARRFIYPPFAAQVFQLLGIFPLKTAAWLFYLASVYLIFVAVRISRAIVQQSEPTRLRGRLPLILAVLFSFNFMQNNLTMVQVNQLTFVLCLLGIQAFVERRELAAGGWLVTATAIKVTPLFFVVWAVIRGTRRTLAAVVAFLALCLVLPMIQRGFAQGIVDLTTYYQSFLHEFAAGRVIANYLNQNLASMIYRALIPGSSADVPPYEYAFLPSLEGAAPLIYRVLALTILAVFLVHLIRLRTLRRPLGALEISSVFLASHLLSGITWKAHLVTFLFVFYAFFSLDPRRMSRTGKVALGIAWVGIGASGLGRDAIGGHLYHYAGGYSLIVWVMLLLFALSVGWSERTDKSVSGKEKA